MIPKKRKKNNIFELESSTTDPPMVIEVISRNFEARDISLNVIESIQEIYDIFSIQKVFFKPFNNFLN